MERYIQLYNVNYIIARFSNVYGLRQTPHGEAGVISIFIDKILNNKELNIFGDGNQTRDFIFVLDIANIFLELIKNDVSNKILNISTNTKITINELCNIL